MKFAFLISCLVYSAIGLNLEFNSTQFPSWIKSPFIYSSFAANPDEMEIGQGDVYQSSCVYLMPINDEAENKSIPYIFESKCYINTHCSGEIEREASRSTMIHSYMCDKVSGTIDKVVLFPIAEFSYQANAIISYVYIIIEGCSYSDNKISNELTWILTNDTKYTKEILTKYKIDLPLNDNKFYFGEMTFGGGDRNCSNLCAPLICEQSMEVGLEREEDSEVNTTSTIRITPTTKPTPKNNPVRVRETEDMQGVFQIISAASSGLIIYVAFGVVLVVSFSGYFMYRKYKK